MSPAVTDASAVVEYLLGSDAGVAASATIESSDVDLHVPSLCDVEVASALRGLALANKISLERAMEAVEDYSDLPITRHGHLFLLERALTLRHNFSAYDAMYLALAEALEAKLLSCDAPFVTAVKTHVPHQALVVF